jgi:hypothetical protein
LSGVGGGPKNKEEVVAKDLLVTVSKLFVSPTSYTGPAVAEIEETAESTEEGESGRGLEPDF